MEEVQGCSVFNIGNTDFEECNIAGGGNIFELDFAGAYQSEKHGVAIVGSGGTLKISVPLDSGEKLNVTSIATPVNVSGDGWEKSGSMFVKKKYVTSNYNTQNVKIDFDMTVVGSIVSVDRE